MPPFWHKHHADMLDHSNKFEHEEGGASKFRMGGDPRFNIPEVLAQRQMLRESQRLKTASLQFWSVLGKAPGETMSKVEYTHVHQRIARALAPELSAAEAIEACEEDWEEDCGGAESISFEEYADGLYALADMWTSNVDELEYVIFLNKLLSMVKPAALAAAAGWPSMARGALTLGVAIYGSRHPRAHGGSLGSIEEPGPLGPHSWAPLLGPTLGPHSAQDAHLAAFAHAGFSAA